MRVIFTNKGMPENIKISHINCGWNKEREIVYISMIVENASTYESINIFKLIGKDKIRCELKINNNKIANMLEVSLCEDCPKMQTQEISNVKVTYNGDILSINESTFDEVVKFLFK